MTIQTLARTIVEAVLARLDDHLFAVIPATDIQSACQAVEAIIREESASWVEPEEA